jgi:aspartate-semialdehyde dehydrogenase
MRRFWACYDQCLTTTTAKRSSNNSPVHHRLGEPSRKRAFDELGQQTRDVLEDRTPSAQAFSYQLAFNVIPHIDVFQEGDYTKEEWKMVKETRKIMGDDSIKMTATCVRVPVFFSHSESVNIETEKKLTADEARNLLRSAPGVTLIDDPGDLKYPMPIHAAHTDDTFVGRIREDFSIENGLNLWIVADNIRKGAALNAVQIAEQLVADDLVRAYTEHSRRVP